MHDFFMKNGLIHQTSCPNTPQQNGVAERRNRKLLEMTQAMLFDAQVPKIFWPEAIATSAYLLNRLPTQVLHHKIPLQVLATQTAIPPILTLPPRVFGCSVFVHTPKSIEPNLILVQKNVFLLGMINTKKGIGATIQSLIVFM